MSSDKFIEKLRGARSYGAIQKMRRPMFRYTCVLIKNMHGRSHMVAVGKRVNLQMHDEAFLIDAYPANCCTKDDPIFCAITIRHKANYSEPIYCAVCNGSPFGSGQYAHVDDHS